ncbi:MAG: serine hydrolase domain-containing protein [Micropruina sp.]
MSRSSAQASLRDLVTAGRLPGITVAVARHGEVEFIDSIGYLDVEHEVALKPDSILRIYSMTKPVIATAVMQLVEEGALTLQDPVARWIPGFAHLRVMEDDANPTLGTVPPAREVSIRHLLTHTSGISYGFQQAPGVCEDSYRTAGLVGPTFALTYPLDDLVDRICGLPLAFQPGMGWRYGLNFDVLGHLLEIISGQRLDTYLTERILQPLGMTDTGFSVPASERSRFGPLYAVTEGVGLNVVDPVQNSPWTRPDVVLSGGAGLVSTAIDYLRFALMVRGGGQLDGVRILRQSTIAEMTTNQLSGPEMPVRWEGVPDPALGHGYGFGVSVTEPHRFGWIGINGGQVWIYPTQDVVVLAIAQTFMDFSASDAFIAAVAPN